MPHTPLIDALLCLHRELLLEGIKPHHVALAVLSDEAWDLIQRQLERETGRVCPGGYEVMSGLTLKKVGEDNLRLFEPEHTG